jgi:hypothetical protein
MKLYFLFFLVILINLSCSSNRKKDCFLVSQGVESAVYDFYTAKNDTSNIGFCILRWQNLLDGLCENLINQKRFLIIEISSRSSGNQEGLLYLIDKEIFYYFKRNGKSVKVKPQSFELENFKKLANSLKLGFKELIKGIVSKTTHIINHDAPNVDFFYFDVNDREKSSFFSIEYSPDFFKDL